MVSLRYSLTRPIELPDSVTPSVSSTLCEEMLFYQSLECHHQNRHFPACKLLVGAFDVERDQEEDQGRDGVLGQDDNETIFSVGSAFSLDGSIV